MKKKNIYMYLTKEKNLGKIENEKTFPKQKKKNAIFPNDQNTPAFNEQILKNRGTGRGEN